MWPRNQSIFVSSTYQDLKYERRAVIRLLMATGYKVLAMESGWIPAHEAFRWSIQSAQKADIFVLLFDRSSGSTSSPDILPGLPPMPFTHWEAKVAQHATAVQLVYHLNRPFPDWQRLVDDEVEAKDYLSTLRAGRETTGLGARPLYLQHRSTRQISSIQELLEVVGADLHRAWLRVACHRAAPTLSRKIEYMVLNLEKWLMRRCRS